jgi:hypothetical protein
MTAQQYERANEILSRLSGMRERLKVLKDARPDTVKINIFANNRLMVDKSIDANELKEVCAALADEIKSLEDEFANL